MADLVHIKKHLDDGEHKLRLKNRAGRIQGLQRFLGEINKQEPRSRFTTSVNANKSSPMLRIRCSVCPHWEHKTTITETVSHMIDIVEAHAISSEHKANMDLPLSSQPGPARSKPPMEMNHMAQNLLKRQRQASDDDHPVSNLKDSTH